MGSPGPGLAVAVTHCDLDQKLPWIERPHTRHSGSLIARGLVQRPHHHVVFRSLPTALVLLAQAQAQAQASGAA